MIEDERQYIKTVRHHEAEVNSPVNKNRHLPSHFKQKHGKEHRFKYNIL